MVHGPTHIAGNRLNLVVVNVPDIKDVVIGTPHGTSDHCFISCVLRVGSNTMATNLQASTL